MSGGSEKKVLAIVGLGLLGASIAEATRKRYGGGWKIIGVSSPNTVKEALNIGLIDEGLGYDKVREALAQCDLAFLCTPIDSILKLLREFVENPVALKPGAVISDVGSTKSEVCALGQKAFPPGGSGVFLGSHPMAGSEKTGLKARDAHLFENAAWILSWDVHYAGNLGTDAAQKASSLLEKFVEGLGARTLFLAPNYHDYLIAYASHAPQLLSIALASVVRGVGGEGGSADSVDILPQVVGGGFRDMTRLAASSFAVWEPILRSNKEFILDALKAYRQELESMEVALEESEGAEGLKPVFSEANALRARFNAPRKGFSSPTTEILVDLEDRPGELLKVLSPLSERKINVLDLEILKVREGEEGVLMMGFHKAEEAQAALDLLSKSGHQARLR